MKQKKIRKFQKQLIRISNSANQTAKAMDKLRLAFEAVGNSMDKTLDAVADLIAAENGNPVQDLDLSGTLPQPSKFKAKR